MSRQDRIKTMLEVAFQPDLLEVTNESHLHAGHQPEFTGGGETHMRVKIVAKAFYDMNRVERHRAVNVVLKPEFDNGLHALSVDASAPQ